MPFLEKINTWLENVSKQYEQQTPPPQQDTTQPNKPKLTASQKKLNKAIMESNDPFLLSSLVAGHRRGNSELVDLLTNNPELCNWIVEHLSVPAYRKLPKEARDIIDIETAEG